MLYAVAITSRIPSVEYMADALAETYEGNSVIRRYD